MDEIREDKNDEEYREEDYSHPLFKQDEIEIPDTPVPEPKKRKKEQPKKEAPTHENNSAPSSSYVPPHQHQDEEEMNEWDRGISSDPEPVLLSDYEHKAFLVNPFKQKRLVRPDDILDKDFSLSILDQEQAFIYGIKATCSEEWLTLGFPNLAHRRKAHLKLKLGLFRSVGGIERFLQTGQANVSTEMDLMNKMVTPQEAVEKKTGQSTQGWRNWFKP